MFRGGLAGLLLFNTVVSADAPAKIKATGSSLNLTSVLALTEQHHPMLARIDAERRRLEPSVILASTAPPLKLEVESENIGDDSADRLESTLSLSGVLDWSRQQRADVVMSKNDAVSLHLEQHRRDVLAGAATRFVALAGAEADLEQARREWDVVRQTQRATQTRQRAGAASPADIKRAALLEVQARLRVDTAKQALDSARMSLQLAMGDVPLPTKNVEANLMTLPPLPDADALQRLAEESPAVRLADARLRIARSQQALALRRARPDIEWRVGVRDDRDQDDQSLVAGLSVPLFSARRSRPHQEIADAEVELAGHDQELAQLELQSLLLEAWQSLNALRRQSIALDSELIPRARGVADALREGHARGRYGLLDLSTAERELNALIGQRLAANIQYHQSWIELERLLGRPLVRENQS